MTDTFATPEELKSLVQRDDLGVTGIMALEAATSLIQELTGQTIFRVEADPFTLDGRGGARKLFLPQLPVNSVTLSLDGTTLVEDTDFRLDGDTGILTRWPDGSFWTTGRNNVSGVYDHGWDQPPPLVRLLCLRLAAKMWDNPTSLKSERTATYSATFGDLIDADDEQILSLFRLVSS